MSPRGPQHRGSVFDATCCALEPLPGLTLELPADMRATFQAHAEVHRMLRDVHPQRLAVASLLLDALIDSAAPAGGERQPVELRIWRLPGRLHVELRASAKPLVRDGSRRVMDCLAAHWECDVAAGCVRIEVLTTLSAPPCAV